MNDARVVALRFDQRLHEIAGIGRLAALGARLRLCIEGDARGGRETFGLAAGGIGTSGFGTSGIGADGIDLRVAIRVRGRWWLLGRSLFGRSLFGRSLFGRSLFGRRWLLAIAAMSRDEVAHFLLRVAWRLRLADRGLRIGEHTGIGRGFRIGDSRIGGGLIRELCIREL